MNSLKSLICGLLIGLFCVLPGIRMAEGARTFNGTSDYMEVASAVVSSEPLTMACRLKPASTAVTTVMSIGTSGGISRWQMSHGYLGTGCAAISADSGGTVAVSSTGSTESGSWLHYAAVFSSSTSRTAYRNGVAGSVDTTSKTVSGVNVTNIGARYSTTVGSYFSGDIAEAAVWSVALNADEIASLAKGFSPRQIRPQSLVFYAPLVRTVQDVRGGVALTDTVPTTAADHPPVRN